MFSGLSAFPLTPMNETAIAESAFVRLIERAAGAGVDSIGVLGSTGSYAYLGRAERARIVGLAVRHAGDVPVIAGVGALRTRDVLDLAEDAQQAGARGVLLAPMSYQPLSSDEVFALFADVSRVLSVPLCVYDNPTTTHFQFSDALHGRIAQLPHVASIKIPPVPHDPDAARARVQHLRSQVPAHVTLGVSGDAAGAAGLLAGCDAWYSAIAGAFPQVPVAITRAAQDGNAREAQRLSDRLAPLWTLFQQHGSLRVIATAAELCGLVPTPCLPLPIKSLEGEVRKHLAAILDALQLFS